MGYHKSNKYSYYGSSEGEEIKIGIKAFNKTLTKNFQSIRRNMDIQGEEAQRSSHGFNPKRSSWRYTLIKTLKVRDKERLVKYQEKSFNV